MTEGLGPAPIHRVLVAFGSNTGDRLQNIEKSLAFIREIPTTQIRAQSQFKEYPAYGVAEPQPPFLNGVLILETELLPLDLLEKLQIIERRLGRNQKGDMAPRPIDLDILSFGEGVFIAGKTLTVPHPRLHERRFVLEPIVEILPDWVHPRLKKTARELLHELERENGKCGLPDRRES